MTIDTKAQPPAAAPAPAERRARRRRLTRRHRWRWRSPSSSSSVRSARFVLGARPQEIENRRLTEFPSLSDGWSFFPQFTTWATDHLPLRGEAVRGNAALSEALFGEAPSYRGETDGGPTSGVPADGEGSEDGGAAEDYPRVIAGRRGLAVLRRRRGEPVPADAGRPRGDGAAGPAGRPPWRRRAGGSCW